MINKINKQIFKKSKPPLWKESKMNQDKIQQTQMSRKNSKKCKCTYKIY